MQVRRCFIHMQMYRKHTQRRIPLLEPFHIFIQQLQPQAVSPLSLRPYLMCRALLCCCRDSIASKFSLAVSYRSVTRSRHLTIKEKFTTGNCRALPAYPDIFFVPPASPSLFNHWNSCTCHHLHPALSAVCR